MLLHFACSVSKFPNSTKCHKQFLTICAIDSQHSFHIYQSNWNKAKYLKCDSFFFFFFWYGPALKCISIPLAMYLKIILFSLSLSLHTKSSFSHSAMNDGRHFYTVTAVGTIPFFVFFFFCFICVFCVCAVVCSVRILSCKIVFSIYMEQNRLNTHFTIYDARLFVCMCYFHDTRHTAYGTRHTLNSLFCYIFLLFWLNMNEKRHRTRAEVLCSLLLVCVLDVACHVPSCAFKNTQTPKHYYTKTG